MSAGTNIEKNKRRRWLGRSSTVARGGLRRRSPRLSAIYGGKGQPVPGPTAAATATELDSDDGNEIPMAPPPSRSTRSQSNKRHLSDSDSHPLQILLEGHLCKWFTWMDSKMAPGRVMLISFPIIALLQPEIQCFLCYTSPCWTEPTTNNNCHSIDDSSWLPEKHILELILDILQRRDTYEIFAEPVDQGKVEDYYEIIKEPMDFGTMRAKLHEGMYKSLQQFEHDVFLIFRNAMHFNTSATIFFRQARLLDDLAKKVFHVLKTDPKKFEVEFSSTRQRSGRRTSGDHRLSNLSLCSKLARDLRTNCTSADVTLKGKGDGGERRQDIIRGDQRSTYRPWTSLPRDNDATITSLYYRTMPLVYVKQQDIGYRESLMSFARDLGPTAQRVAKLKLQERWNFDLLSHSAAVINSNDPPPSCNRAAAPSPPQVEPLHFGVDHMTNPVLKSFLNRHLYESTDLGNIKRSKEALQYDAQRVDVLAASIIDDGTPASHGNSSHISKEEGIMNSRKSLVNIASNSFSSNAQDINSLVKIGARYVPAETVRDTGELSNAAKPFEVGNLQYNQLSDFDLNHSTGPELGLAYYGENDQAIAAPGSRMGASYPGNKFTEANDPNSSTASKFNFDLPYLQSRLSEMNSFRGTASNLQPSFWNNQ